MVKKTPQPDKTIVEEILELLDAHIETTTAIVQDYVGGPGLETELSAAHDNLYKAIANKEEEVDFYSVLKQLKGLDTDDIDGEKLIQVLKDNDYDDEKLLELIDPSDFDSWAAAKGYCFIKVPGMIQRDKLETFLHSEIYPFLKDQEANIIM